MDRGLDAGRSARLALLVSAGGSTCAIPSQCVCEIMRPLPLQEVAGAPAYLAGLSVIRGAATPVVDLNLLMGGATYAHAARRLVLVDVDDRRVALAVHDVYGLRRLDLTQRDALPPLLRDSAGDAVEAIGVADAQLMMLLRTGRLVPDEVWTSLTTGQEAR